MNENIIKLIKFLQIRPLDHNELEEIDERNFEDEMFRSDKVGYDTYLLDDPAPCSLSDFSD